MAQHTIVFASDTSKIFVANPKQQAGYGATVQNNTNQTITIKVTNEDVQNVTSPTYSAVAAGAISVLVGEMGAIAEPYQAWEITCAAATGTVDITELG